MSTPSPGDVLAAKYRVERVLGTGGMGVVVLATHVHLEQQVAIKLLLPEALQNAEAIRRFVQEAKAAARLRGEHVVRVHDVGTLDDGNPFLVMEYLEGEDLDSLLRARGRITPQEAADYVLQACEAIAEAHGVGIVHRDLKPANLFLATLPDGTRTIKVLDFGISKIAPRGGAMEAVTKTRALMGSPLYMSPEQMRSTKSVTAKADVWALGVILYELVVGAPPFMAETMPQICALVLTEPMPVLETVCPGAPPELAAAIDMATRKEPGDRSDIGEFARALSRLASPAGKLSAERVIRVSLVAPSPLSSPGVDSARGARVSLTPASSQGALPAEALSGKTSLSVSGPPSWSASGERPAVLEAAGTSPATGPHALSHIPNRPATLSTFGTTAPPVGSRARPALWAATAIACTAVLGFALYSALKRPDVTAGSGASSAAAIGRAAVVAKTESPAADSAEPPPKPPATTTSEQAPPMVPSTGSAAAPVGPRPPSTSGTLVARPVSPASAGVPKASTRPAASQKPAGPSDDPFDNRYAPH